MLRKLLLMGLAAFALIHPALAQEAPAKDDPQLAKIAQMPLKELEVFLGGIATAVNQDSLKLRGFAQNSDCLDLTRAANSFALGYTYLGAVRDTAAKRPEKDAQLVRVKAIQLRVTTFASRIRAEEWLSQRCGSFVVPADQASDTRYARPAKVTNAEYTDAVIDARQAAETNLAIAVNAGISGKCPDVVAASQNIVLLIPYLQKLLVDTAKRPEVLGPRASRRGLEVSRRQLTAAFDKLQAEFGDKCRTPKPASAPGGTESKPAE